MKRLILTLFLGMVGSYSYAAEVVVGSNNQNVIAILGLQVGGEIYDVEFWSHDFLSLYGPHQDRFPFIGDTAGAAAASG